MTDFHAICCFVCMYVGMRLYFSFSNRSSSSKFGIDFEIGIEHDCT